MENECSVQKEKSSEKSKCNQIGWRIWKFTYVKTWISHTQMKACFSLATWTKELCRMNEWMNDDDEKKIDSREKTQFYCWCCCCCHFLEPDFYSIHNVNKWNERLLLALRIFRFLAEWIVHSVFHMNEWWCHYSAFKHYTIQMKWYVPIIYSEYWMSRHVQRFSTVPNRFDFNFFHFVGICWFVCIFCATDWILSNEH